MEEVQSTGAPSLEETSSAARDAEAAARRAAEALENLHSPADLAVRALVDKIDACSAVSDVYGHIPIDFRGCVMDFTRKYHEDVLRLGAVATHYAKLVQHQANGTYPTAIHSIREPKIQWSKEFMAAPQSSRRNFAVTGAPNARDFVGFSESIQMGVTALKDEILKSWIAEKQKELTLFQKEASAETGSINLRKVLDERMSDLRSRFTYDIAGGRPIAEPIPRSIREIIEGRTFQHEVLHRAAPQIIAKVNNAVLNVEDRRLADALKRMDISAEAPRISSETKKNDVAALAKKVAELTKKLDGKKKVSETLLPFILCSASTLHIDRRSLSDLCLKFLDATQEEVDEGEERWAKADHNQNPHRQKEEGRLCLRKAEGKEVSFKEKGREKEGFREEEWQEIGLACEFWDSYLGSSCTMYRERPLAKICTSCATRSFLSSFYPLSLVLNPALRIQIQICSWYFQVHVLSSCRKINIFDYTTYPPIVTYMP